MLKLVGEVDCVVRTCRNTHLAERTTAKVVQIFHQYFFLLPVGQLHHLRLDVDCLVRAVHLAQSASNTLVVAFFIIDELQRATKTFAYRQIVSVVRIFLRHLLRDELLSCHFHSLQKADHTFA